jgi:hypothetical protein
LFSTSEFLHRDILASTVYQCLSLPYGQTSQRLCRTPAEPCICQVFLCCSRHLWQRVISAAVYNGVAPLSLKSFSQSGC